MQSEIRDRLGLAEDNGTKPADEPARLLRSLGWCAALVVLVIAGAFCLDVVVTDPLPQAAAYDVVERTAGLKPGQLKTAGGGYSAGAIGRTGYLAFDVKAEPSRRITVRFARRFPFFPWELVEYRDEPREELAVDR